uniref:Uncharacterized protein n=1 Tax=Oryza rufipogon TaxID=4529 RepID=A0A0E0PZH2_ORYRU
MPQPYNLRGFCRCLLVSGLDSGLSLIQRREDPIQQCREILHRDRCLVIIDEVHSKEDWDSITDANLITATSKSCIVVITTQESVAVHCAGANGLVCSITCLQATAASDLFQQAFQEAFTNNRNMFEVQEFQRNGDSYEETFRYIFEGDEQEEQAFQNDGNLFKEQSVQNNGNSMEVQICENNGNSCEEQIFQNNRNYFQGEASQNDGNSIKEQSGYGNSCEEKTFQSNRNYFQGQAFQNDGNSFKEQSVQNNGNSIEEQICENNGNSCEVQIFQNNKDYFQGQASQNTEKSFIEQAFQNNGNSFEQTFQWFSETNKQEEHEFENNGSPFEEYVFPNMSSWFQKHVSLNCENLYEEKSFQNSENPFEELVLLNKKDLLEELESQNNNNLSEEKTLQNIKHSMSRDDPNVKAILSRSGGLPQVIVALARYWANQYMSNIEDKREREWQCQYLIANFMQELQTSQEFYCLRGLFAWMHSYFCSCPPSLMRSMLYLLIFPQGKTFRRRRLVRRWIAEGYASGSESNSLEEMGELFHKLSSQSVIRQATMDGCYEFNGFFHEYMISRPVEERILLPLEVSVLEGYCWRLTTKGDIGQHLAIWNSWDRNKTLFDSLDLLRLRSLTVFGPWESFFISNKMGVLRVLDLEDACDVTDVDVENIGKVLHRLKFLSLRGHKITYLPDSFGGLRHLQTLDIRCTSIINLPTSITKLKKLQYVRAGNPVPVPLDDDTSTDGILRLRPPPPEAASATASPSLSEPSTSMSRPHAATAVSRLFELRETWTSRHRGQQPAVAGTCNGGIVVPRGIRKMTTLHTLGVIDVSVAKKGRAILEELKNLTQLRKLGVSGISRRNCREFCSAISGHAHLESLSVHLNKENNRGCLDAISKPPENLKSLKLYGYADDKLPEWITLLRKLSKLNLQMAMLPSGDGLQFHSGFDSLVILKISCSPSLQAVTFHSGVMPSLECLKLRCCNVSSLRLSGLEALTGLKEVWFGGSYREAFKRELKRQIGQLPREMKPVLKEEQRLP